MISILETHQVTARYIPDNVLQLQWRNMMWNIGNCIILYEVGNAEICRRTKESVD